MSPALPDGVARCEGSGSDAEGWREGCEDCMRRTAPATEGGVPPVTPPPIIAFWCEFHIDPGSRWFA